MRTIILMILALSLSTYLSTRAQSDPLFNPAGDCAAPIACNLPDGAIDYWQTPAETCKRGGGDCDDFAAIDFFKYEAQGAWFVIGWVDGIGHAWVELNGETLDSCYPGGTRIVYMYLRRGVFITLAGIMGNPEGLHRWTDLLRRQDEYLKAQLEAQHE